MSRNRRQRLARLLDIRRLKEASTRQEYGLAMRSEERAIDRVRTEAGRLDAARATSVDALRQRAITIESLVRLHQDVLYREQTHREREADRERETRLREDAESLYRAARRDSKSLERLEDREREQEESARRRAEQKITDEAALRRFMTRMDGEGAPSPSDGS